MATQGPNFPTVAVDAGDGDGWVNPTNAEAADGVFAVGNYSSSGFSDTGSLKTSAFGFSIPAGATINGITVEVNIKASNASSFSGASDRLAQLRKAGTLVGSNLATTTQLPATSTTFTYGGSANLWGTTWTDTDINASNFGIDFAATETGPVGGTVSVDFIRITIAYTAGATTTSTSSTSQSTSTSISTSSTSQSTSTSLSTSSTSHSTSISTSSTSSSISTSTSQSTSTTLSMTTSTSSTSSSISTSSTSASTSVSTSTSSTSTSTSHSTSSTSASTSISTSTSSISTSLSTSTSSTSQSTSTSLSTSSTSTSHSTSSTSISTSSSTSTSSTSASTSHSTTTSTSSTSSSTSSTSASTSTTTVLFSAEIPVIGIFPKSRLTATHQIVDSGTLVDDPIALVDDPAALVGGKTVIDSGIIRDMSTDKPSANIRKHR